MKRIGVILAAILWPALAEAHNYGCAYCSYAQAGQYGIIRHVDGTYWNSQGTVQYELGATPSAYSSTGWVQWFYALPFKPSQTVLQGYQPLAAQGSSIYGYSETTTATYGASPSYQASAAVYTPDYSQFLNQAARLAEQSAQLNSQAYQGFVSSTTLLNAQAIELAKIDHVRDAAIAALNAAKGPAPESVQRSITLTLKPDSQGNLQVTTSRAESAATTSSNPTDAFITIVGNNCSRCHAQASTNAEARKKLRLEEFTQWDGKTFAAISDAVDSNKMPPHNPLSRADKAVVFAMESFVAAGNRPVVPQPTPDQPPPPPQTPTNLPPPPPIPDEKPADKPPSVPPPPVHQ